MNDSGIMEQMGWFDSETAMQKVGHKGIIARIVEGKTKAKQGSEQKQMQQPRKKERPTKNMAELFRFQMNPNFDPRYMLFRKGTESKRRNRALALILQTNKPTASIRMNCKPGAPGIHELHTVAEHGCKRVGAE